MKLKEISSIEIAYTVLRDIVVNRYQDVLKHPEKLKIDRWDLSDCYYPTRKVLEDKGYETSPLNDEHKGWRKKIYTKVRDICENELGVKRHEAGIFPAERAVMAFNGQLYSIGFDNLEWLRYQGPDVIFIEKAGIVEKLIPFTKDLGVALVHSQGFYSEYAEMLAEEAVGYDCNLGLLTDFDASGVTMGLKIKGSFRLGADLQMVEDLGLNIEKLQESSLTKKGNPSSHWIGLDNTVNGKKKHRKDKEWTYEQKKFYIPYLTQKRNDISYIEYLKTKRIELNIIVDSVGAQRFWEWLRQKILDTFPTRDYVRAVSIPWYIPTPTMKKFEDHVEKITRGVVEQRRDEIAQKLEKTGREFFVVKDKNKEVREDLLNNTILKNSRIRLIDSRLKRLMEELED